MSRNFWRFDEQASRAAGVLVLKEEPEIQSVHGVIQDTWDATECPADGKTYESRSAYYRAVKAAGCEVSGEARGDGIDTRRALDTAVERERRHREGMEKVEKVYYDLRDNRIPRDRRVPEKAAELWRKVSEG